MTKAELATIVASKLGVTVKSVTETLDTFYDTVKESVAKGHTIQIRGFGNFYPKQLKARKARNMQTNEIIDVPARVEPGFKVSKEFVQLVKEAYHD